MLGTWYYLKLNLSKIVSLINPLNTHVSLLFTLKYLTLVLIYWSFQIVRARLPIHRVLIICNFINISKSTESMNNAYKIQVDKHQMVQIFKEYELMMIHINKYKLPTGHCAKSQPRNCGYFSNFTKD